MRQKFLYIFLLLLALVRGEQVFAWGENTSWLAVSTGEKSWTSPNNSGSYTLPDLHGTTLSFDARTEAILGFWSKKVHAQYSTDNSNWTDVLEATMDNKDTWYTFTATIPANAKYVRFQSKTGQTGTRRINNVKVTRATTLSTSTTALDFGTVTNRLSATLNAVIDYNNTTYNQQVTGTCTDANFTVTPTTVGAYGNNQAVPVTFTPTTAGTHTGTVTLTMNGKTVTFSVQGVGKTTYYTRATAAATTGGSAYVSFTSFEAATNASDTKNSGVTTEANASTVAYYRAVPNQRYAFLGWKANLSDATYVSTDAEFQTPAYTYNSESSANPTVVTYYAVFEEKPNVITLEPTNSDYDADLYEQVTLHRTFAEGYSTIALPFSTTVSELTGRSSDNDWIAQFYAVTYNQHDGFTLFFQKKTNGRINAFEPYILHLGDEVVDPSWTNIELTAATPVTITATVGYDAASSPTGNTSYADWQMTSNFTSGKDMNGLYGIVNAAGGLKLGGAGSTLNAFTAYITPPANSGYVKTRSAFIDNDGTTTFIDGLPFEESSALDPRPSTIFGLDGIRRQQLGRGINIMRQADGTVRKVLR